MSQESRSNAIKTGKRKSGMVDDQMIKEKHSRQLRMSVDGNMMGAVPSNGLPHPRAVKCKSLQNVLDHPGAKRLSMSATIKTAEAQIIVQ